MQFDILNELLTSTVSDLFAQSSRVSYESKTKVKELEGLIRQENTSRRSSNISLNDSTYSVGSESAVRTQPLRKYNTVEQWMSEEAPRRLAESIKKIGVKQILLKSNKRAELQQFIDQMKTDTLATQKKKVKNELRCYDNDFKTLFNRLPNHHQKQPFRPLYVYYKKLKQFLERKGGQQMSQQAIEAEITRIKQERKQLRVRIEAYQRQFQANNNRRIRYVRDIQPIDGQYKKYKDLKNDLLKYEEMLKNN